jgi:maleate isomerase
MQGWRGRIGLIFPSDEVHEKEYWDFASEGVSVHPTRFEIPAEITEENVRKFQEGDNLEKLCRQFPLIKPGCIIFACTAGSFIRGHGFDQKIITRLEKAGMTKATTASTAIVAASQALGLKQVDVITPYLEELNHRLKTFLEAHDIRVGSIKGFQLKGGFQDISPQQVYRMTMDNLSKHSDGVIISCTNLRVLDVLPFIERDSGKPVVSANQASMWHALRLMGIKDKSVDRGLLFQQ